MRSLNLSRMQPLAFAAVLAVLTVLPWIGLDRFWVRQLVLVAMLALVVSGLNLTFGFAGELALGQAAVYAAGAYAAGYFAKTYVNDVVLMLVLASVIAVLVGLLVGAPGIRLGGWMLAIGSFFLVLLVPDFVNIIGDPLGGYEGLTSIPLPAVVGMELDANGFYVVTMLVTGVWFALFRNLIRSPRGAEFRVLGAGETLSASLGISTYRLKLKAYAIGAIPAGLAGCLFAYLDGYVSATSFGLHATILILAASVLGGMNTIYGAIVGAGLMQLGPMTSSAFQDYSLVAFGALLLLGGVFLPHGLTPLLTHALRRVMPFRAIVNAPDDIPGRPAFGVVDGGRLEVEDVVKSFGGIRALTGVTLAAQPGRVTALIGPNGSGKTTLLNVICGYYGTDEGAIRINGCDIGEDSAAQRAAGGIGRTFQTPTIPSGLTVRETIRTGAIGLEANLLATVLRLPSYRRREAGATAQINAIMAGLGIADRAEEMASALPLGTRRLVELGRALALEPAVLLLDEVASGLDKDEVIELSGVISSLVSAGATIVLVEHNFDLIMAVADDVFVLAEGALLAQGAPQVVAADPLVRRTYLGAGVEERPGEELAEIGGGDGVVR